MKVDQAGVLAFRHRISGVEVARKTKAMRQPAPLDRHRYKMNYLIPVYQPILSSNTDPLSRNHVDHLKREYQRLCTDATPPQLWFLTATFVPVEVNRDDGLSIPPHRCIEFFERFYVRLLPKLMSNFERKRWLQPLTYLYIDYPFTKRDKTFAVLSAIEQFRRNQFRFHPEHPETTPHIHAVMLIPPQLVQRFEAVLPNLEFSFQGLGPANRTLHAVPLQTTDALRNVIFYSSKLLKRPPAGLRDVDLYTVLPKARSEPVYVKSAWERELMARKESRP